MNIIIIDTNNSNKEIEINYNILKDIYLLAQNIKLNDLLDSSTKIFLEKSTLFSAKIKNNIILLYTIELQKGNNKSYEIVNIVLKRYKKQIIKKEL